MGTQADRAFTAPWATAVADPTGKRGVYRYAASTTQASAVIPTALRGKFMNIVAAGADVQISLGYGAAPSIVADQLSAFGTGHASAGETVRNGFDKRKYIPQAATHIAWVSKAATGFVEFTADDGA